MIRKVAALATIAGVVLLGGCSQLSPPTYTEVRQETLDAMDEVVALIPSHGRIERTPEFDPYPCDDRLLLGSRKGAFFTGQWTVAVPADFDLAGFIHGVPEILPGWHEEDLGVPAKEPYVYMVRESPRMTLSIEESTLDDQSAIELLAISRCGIEDPAG